MRTTPLRSGRAATTQTHIDKATAKQVERLAKYLTAAPKPDDWPVDKLRKTDITVNRRAALNAAILTLIDLIDSGEVEVNDILQRIDHSGYGKGE
jgi:hypothetical protein